MKVIKLVKKKQICILTSNLKKKFKIGFFNTLNNLYFIKIFVLINLLKQGYLIKKKCLSRILKLLSLWRNGREVNYI